MPKGKGIHNCYAVGKKYFLYKVYLAYSNQKKLVAYSLIPSINARYFG